MTTKLTLEIDDELVERANAHARRTGLSVSQIVGGYFAELGAGDGAAVESTAAPRIGHRVELTPTVRSLYGCLAGSGVSEKDYFEYLERKHL